MRMQRFQPTQANLLLLAGAGLLMYIIYKGGPAKAFGGLARIATEGAVNAAGGAVVGVVTGASDAVGIPNPDQTTVDPRVARWIMDDPRGGQMAASQWASVSAYLKALTMDSGTGIPPPPNSPIAQAFPPYINTGGASGGW